MDSKMLYIVRETIIDAKVRPNEESNKAKGSKGLNPYCESKGETNLCVERDCGKMCL